jgi:7-cyano-7-deazaguanine synthase
MKKTIVVLSGGMDSATALAWALDRSDEFEVVGCIQFAYGSKHNEQERLAACRLVGYYNVNLQMVDLDFIGKIFKSDLLISGGEIPLGHYADPSMKRTVVPFRNGIMLSIAAGYAESLGAQCVILGNHFGDHAIYPDCRKDFIEPMREAIKQGTYAEIELISPFCDLSKTQIATYGVAINVPYVLTYSCYQGGESHCGECGTCVERKEAFEQAGVTDPTRYLK